MITMSKAATNTSSSSEDDGNDGNLQGIYDKDERFTSADYIAAINLLSTSCMRMA